jgi:hypothetical protein
VSATLTAVPVSPYKGLANYTEQDAALFFGREREREIIIANFKARRLTLLYGESGVGKSSLLRAGVMADLRETARRNLDDLGTPEHVPIVFSAWSDDPVAGLAAAIRDAVDDLVGEAEDSPDPESLAGVVDRAAERTDADLLVILDQFEEYFLYHPSEDGPGTFAAQFPELVNGRDVQANFLVSIREDALAKLDRFKREIPRLFDSSLRVDHLDAAAAREAIERPVDRYNAVADPTARVALGAGLVDAVIEQVRAGRVVLEQAGQGTLAPGGNGGAGADRIETPYLQLVMSRLWDVERVRRSATLQAATLAELGGAQEIVRTHLDAALRGLDDRQRETAAALFHQLVTPSGSKIAHAVPDLAEYARRPDDEVRDLLEELSRPETRILRPVPPPPGEEGPPRYEIFHDVLAPSVLAWRTRQTAAQRLEEQRRAARAATRRRLLRLVALVGVLGFAAVLALALVANDQRNEAQQQEALARALAAKSEREENRSRRLADVAREQADRADTQRSRAEGETRRANRLSAANRRKTRDARALAAINDRQATEARALADENRRQADRARASARGERRQRDRATDLADRLTVVAQRARQSALDARRSARDARRSAARAMGATAFTRQLASILGGFAPPAFVPITAWRFISDARGTRFTGGVVVPSHTVVTATCTPQVCDPFRATSRESADAVFIPTLSQHKLPVGTSIAIHASSPDVRRTWSFRIRRVAFPRTRSTICIPPGSRLTGYPLCP